MAHRRLLLGLVVAAAACGGRFASDQGVDGSGGSAGSGAGGTGGSTGTGGGVAGAGGAGGAAGGQGGSDWAACQLTDACVLAPVSACGTGCNPALSEFVAVNSASFEDYLKSRPQPPCPPPVMCPAPLPGQLDEANFMALCVGGRCEAIDVRTSVLSQCRTNTDCYARSGTSCCPGCGGPMVAFSYSGAPPQVFCARGPEACPAIACVGLPYVAIPYCNASGHCALQYTGMTVDAGVANR